MSEEHARNVLILFFLILLIGAAAVLLIPHLAGIGGAPQARQGRGILRPPEPVPHLHLPRYLRGPAHGAEQCGE
jgi:hypothetical protein